MFTLNCRGRLLSSDKPVIMGIINITPDSFYSGSRRQTSDAVLEQAERMLQEGATILDIGGQSTRPGSERITEEEECKRILEPIEAVHHRFPGAFISVDTFYASVATRAVAAGASIVNDISAGRFDSRMIETVAVLKVPYVLMHMKGTPQSMQQDASYENVTKEVMDFMTHKMTELREAGITDLIIDPGIGFAKTAAHNFQLLHDLPVFQMLDAPILLGLSRKSFIWRTLETSADHALAGTIVMNTAGLLAGASVLRVHDVREAVTAVKLVEKIQQAR